MEKAAKGYDEKSRQAGRLLFVLDISLTSFVFLASYHLREFVIATNPIDFFAHLALLPLLLAMQGVQMWHSGAYRGLRVSSLTAFSWTVVRTLGVALIALFTILFLLKATYASRGFLLLFGVLVSMVLVAVRAGLIWWYFQKSIEKGENFVKVLIIGTGDRARRLAEKLHDRSEWGIEIIGHLDYTPDANASLLGATVLGDVSEIHAVLKSRVVDEVIIAVPRTMLKDIQQIADACEAEGVMLRLMADVFDLRFSRMGLVDLDGIPLLTFEPVAHSEMKLIVKRIMDLTVTLAAMPVVLPLMAVVAIAIKLDSPGPIFFMQERVGLRKRIFRMRKFRSMYRDAEQRLKELEHLNEAQGPIFKIANDPRVTRVGKILRRTSLDELPQLFNVIRGHMSLVGPRPMSLRDVNLFDEGIQRKRFSVRPGLTCLWQISGRSNLPFTKWIELDLEYIDSWSLGLDLKILLRTIPVVLKGTGAV